MGAAPNTAALSQCGCSLASISQTACPSSAVSGSGVAKPASAAVPEWQAEAAATAQYVKPQLRLAQRLIGQVDEQQRVEFGEIVIVATGRCR